MFQQPDDAQAAMLGQGDIQQAVPQMMPSGGSNMNPAGVPSLSQHLDRMSLPQLLAEFNNPNSSAPRYALLSAINKAAERMRMQQAVQGQQAIAQNAQQQQQTVANQVLGNAMQAEQQGRMNEQRQFGIGGLVAMSGGGVAHYDGGGELTLGYAPEYMEAKKYGIVLNPYDSPEERAAKIERVAQLKSSGATSAPKVDAAPADEESFADKLGRALGMMAGSPSAFARSPEDEDMRKRMSSYRPRTSATEAERAYMYEKAGLSDTAPYVYEEPVKSGTAVRTQGGAPSSGIRNISGAPGAASGAALVKTAVPGIDLSEEERLVKERQTALEGRKTLPTEITEGRKGLAALAQSNIEASRQEAEDFANEAKARRDELMGRANQSLLDDPRAALGLAAAIDPRRGKVFGSMAGGLDQILASRDALKDSAQKEFMAAQATSRQMQANVRQMQMLELQRQQALAEGDFNRANQIQDQIDTLKMDMAKTKVDMQKHAQDIYFKGRAADATDKQAQAAMISAGKPAEMIQTLNFLQKLTPEQQKPLLESLRQFSEAKGGVKAEGARLAELKALQKNLEEQAKDYLLGKEGQEEARKQLKQVNNAIAELAKLPMAGTHPPEIQSILDKYK
jgi:plasmid stabilization system protein ParE